MSRRTLTLGCALGLCLGFAQSAAAQSIFAEIPYLTLEPQHLAVSTDANWSGARRVNPFPFGRPPPLTGQGFGGLGRDYIWARRCGRAAERRTFSQDLLVPGIPSSGRFLFRYAPSRGRPYRGATLRVNGAVVGRLPKTVGKKIGVSGIRAGAIPTRALRAFRYGPNEVKVTVVKSRLKRGQRCQSRKARRNVGVLADIELDFRSDMRVGPPKVSPDVQRDVVEGQTVGVVGTASVTNTGPSASLLGDLDVRVFGDGQSVIGTTAGLPGAPFRDCQITSSTNIGGDRRRSQMHCVSGDFPAGTTASFPIITATKISTANFSQGAGRVYLQIEATPRGGNGSLGGAQTKEIILCQAEATDPACR